MQWLAQSKTDMRRGSQYNKIDSCNEVRKSNQQEVKHYYTGALGAAANGLAGINEQTC